MGIQAVAKRWGRRLALLVLFLWGLWILSATPWVPYRLWQDATRHERLFREVAAEAQQQHLIEPDAERYPELADLGYYLVESGPGGTVFFYRHRRFMGRGILGIAYAPGESIPERAQAEAEFFAVPPHWPFLRMPAGFYIVSGR